MSKNNNFAVIDIGTNAVKCKIYNNSRYITPKNKMLKQSLANDLNENEVVSLVTEFADLTEQYGISKDKLYICATEAFRQTSNQDAIKKIILEKLGRKIHVISPKREAYLSVIGGLKSIPAHRDKNKDVLLSAKNVLYVESGGGSTEISLVNLTSKGPSIVSTVSLPLGSKKYGNDKAIFDKKITDFIKQISSANYSIEDPLICVVNSTAVSKVISHQYKTQKFDAYVTMAKQQKMSLKNLQFKLQDIANNAENKNQIMQEYDISKDRIDGFIGHCHIISNVFKKLYNKRFCPNLNFTPVITTVGGLKDGLAEEILHSGLHNSSDIEKTILTVDECVDNKNHTPVKTQGITDPQDKIQELKHKLNQDTNWIGKLENFYRASTYHYDVSKNKCSLTVEDKFKQKVTYHNKNKITISKKTDITENTFYDDIIANAKKTGQKNIRFNDTVSLDTKLRFYSANLKFNMKIDGFNFDISMLEKVSPETRKIVESAIAQNNNKEKNIPTNTNSEFKTRD